MTPWLLVPILLALPAMAADPPAAEEVRYVMGTAATAQAWADDPTDAQAAVDAAFVAFSAVDSLLSTWRDDSALSALNAAGQGRWVIVGPEVCLVLAEAQAVAKASAGAFDPTVLPLVFLWGFRSGQPALPDSIALARTLESVGYEFLEIDSENGRARLLENEMGVDLGGIAKGYALDRAKEAMDEAGAIGGVIDLGGNILAFGTGPNRQVGIVNPAHTENLLASVPLVNAAAATSGQYERFISLGGRRFGHILDPRTGWPVPGGMSATVVAKRAVVADALATAAVVLGAEKGLALLEEAPDVEGVIAVDDGRGGFDLWATSGITSLSEDR